MQVHSVLWYLVLVAVVGALLRRVLPGTVGALALLIFALDGKHAALVVSWSDRTYVLAATFAFLGLLFHVKWREGGGARDLALSLVGLALGLASSEAALPIFAYLVAYELLAGPGAAGARLRGLVPAALLLGVGALVYVALGYGCAGSDVFVNPLTQTVDWLRAWPTALPVLMGSVLLSIPAESRGSRRGVVADGRRPGGAGRGGPAPARLLEPAHRRGAPPRALAARRRGPRAAGGGRPLPHRARAVPPSLGGAVAIAVVLARGFAPRERTLGAGARVAGAGALALAHLVGSPIIGWQIQSVTAFISRRGGEVQDALARELDPSRLASQRLVVLAVPSLLYGAYSVPRWWATGQLLPRAWWTISIAPSAHRVTRTAPDTLELELREGRFLGTLFERAHRTPHRPLAAGTVVQLDGASVEVAEVDAEGIRKLRLRFDVPLEDPSLVLLRWKDHALRRFTPPPVGGDADITFE